MSIKQPGSAALEITLDGNPEKICCPLPDDKQVWRQHPRVYLAFDETGQVRCPYCSTIYKQKDA